MKYLPLLVVTIVSCNPPPPPAQVPVVLVEKFFPVPPFRFTERGGQTVTNTDLKGNVWVGSFVFTRCTGSCPQVAASLAKLQTEYKTVPDLRFVTFTIDPERDQLADLKKYADRYGADKDRWLFLTGKENEMHEFATNGFKLAAKRSEKPKPGDEFDHSSKIVVVDKNGIIRGYFDGMQDPKDVDGKVFAESQAKLRLTIASLLKE